MKLLLCLGLGLFSLSARAQKPFNQRLKHELDSLQYQDWRYRDLVGRLHAGKTDSLAQALHVPTNQVFSYVQTQMQRADSSNLRRVEDIIWRYGYPGQSLVGQPTNAAAWYVLQHSSKIPQYLVWVKGAAEAGEIPYRLYAQMLDRKLMDDGQEQVFGTQWAGYTVLDHATGRQHTVALIWPVRDPQRVDQRRRQAGLPTTLAQSSAALGIPYQPVSLEYALWLQEEAAQLSQQLQN
ncbi:MAG: hypothetical protein EOO59_15235 [Hymenobacter sp.]|nr:MAG: hypothetical protein EOO59_15235 [Hymenobacter sp.]